ncbi:MAG: hypothetical protein ABI210_11440 [Abditibacteriaceae bacterium]
MNNQLITDLPQRIVGDFQPARGVGEGWIPVTWETAEHSGTGLAAGASSGASELVLDLKLKGRYALHFALSGETTLRAWREGDDSFREFTTQHGGENLQECRMHAQDWTNKRLCISLKNGFLPKAIFLAYIRAEPAEIEYSSARNLIATNDGWSWIALEGIKSARDVRSYFAPLRDSDFGLMLWGPGGADVSGCHNTQAGTFLPTQSTHAFRQGDRDYTQNIRDYIGSDEPEILTAAVEAARETGVGIHFYIRPEAFFAPFPLSGYFNSQYFLDHPELRCRDEFGDEIMRLSYAFPVVQDHMIAYCEELLEYAPDGLCFAFNRSLPMIICEDPVLAEFEKQNGRRPNLPEEVDSDEMIAARETLMNGFLERVYELLKSRGLQFSCMVSPDEELNRNSGLDMQGLAARGIFDLICVHNGGFHALSTPASHLPFWNELKMKTKVYLNGFGGSYNHAETAQFLKGVFDAGFAGGFFWDTENLSHNPYNWEMVRRGGTREYLESASKGETQPPRIIALTRIQGTKLGRYNPQKSY